MMSRLGWLLFIVLTGRWAFAYGDRWNFGGPCCLPRTLLAPDGRHYPDGSPLDPLTQAIVTSGCETQVTVGLLLLLATLFVVFFCTCHAAAEVGGLGDAVRRELEARKGGQP